MLNVQFANKVVETVQKGRVFKVQTDKYELISKTHRVAKAKPQTPSIQTPATPTPTPQKPAVVTPAKPTVFTPAKNEPVKTEVISHQQLFLKKKQVFQIQEAKTQLL